ncbi:hypothetical protein AgCh_012269 [Apium graveolens]
MRTTDVASRMLDGAVKLPWQLFGRESLQGSAVDVNEVALPAKGARDFLRIFKELKKSVTNDWGAVKPLVVEEDKEFLERKDKLQDFENQISNASQQAETLVKAHQYIGKTMGQLGLAFVKLTKFEADEAMFNSQRVKSADMKNVATAAVKASRLYWELNAQTVKILCLPITIDVDTNNQKLLDDEFIIGLKEKRATGQEFAELLEEFMSAVRQNYGEKILIQTSLKALSGAVSYIDFDHHKMLLSSISGMSLWNYGLDVLDVLVELVVSLAAVSGKYLHRCLDMLVRNFVPPLSFLRLLQQPRGLAKKEQVLSHVHAALKEIADLGPLAPLRLEKVIKERMPHRSSMQPWIDQVYYDVRSNATLSVVFQ